MKIAASILDCKDRVKGVMSLNMTNISYIHIDVMDGKFVPSVQFDNIDEIRNINSVTKYPMDVHLMMDNPADYIKELGNMNIEFITIHLEIDKDKKEIFKSIRDLGYKVGLSIKPNTSVEEIVPYLDDIDMVLVMSVEPGLGGQKFIEGSVDRIKQLKELIGERNVLIEVDGGINKDNISKLKDVDISVVGSYITKSDNYYKMVEELLKSKDVIKEEEVIKLNYDEIKKKQRLYKILLTIGILPFCLFVIGGLISMISGVGFFFSTYYGIDAFLLYCLIIGFLCWPVLVVGLILIIVSIVKLKKIKKTFKK